MDDVYSAYMATRSVSRRRTTKSAQTQPEVTVLEVSTILAIVTFLVGVAAIVFVS